MIIELTVSAKSVNTGQPVRLRSGPKLFTFCKLSMCQRISELPGCCLLLDTMYFMDQ